MNTTEYLLTCLGEEGAEITHSASKWNRFGQESTNPLEVDGPTNLMRMIREINDFQAVVELLQEEAILPVNLMVRDMIEAKKEKVRQHMKYSFTCGCLDTIKV